MISLYTATVTLILVMDPLGNIPIFLSILRKFDARQQVKIIIREVLIAAVVLVVFLFCGRYVMQGLGLSMEALGIAGGIILFLIALRMIFPPEGKENIEHSTEEPFFVPLAVPLTAGPSALATVLLFASRNPGANGMMLASIIVATIIFLVVMLLSRYLMRILGRRGLIAVERLMGMILTIVAVQMFLSGLGNYIAVIAK